MSKRYLNADYIKKFIPLRNLLTPKLERAAKKTPIQIIPAKTVLCHAQEETVYFTYLVKGEVELINDKQFKHTVKATEEAANFPISMPPKCKEHVKTLTNAVIIRVDKRLLASLNVPQKKPKTVEVAEVQFTSDSLEGKIFHALHKDYEHDRLTLPTLPDLALRIRLALQKPNTTTKAIARIIQIDPAITAKILQVANSPLYRGVTPIRHCSDAIARLGFDGTKNIVLALTLRRLFLSKHPILKKCMKTLWQHSAEVAAMSYILAKATKGFDHDYAMLAGLLHDVGTVIIITHAEKYPELIKNTTDLDRAIHALRGQIGAMLLKKWGFEEVLVTVAAESECWHRDPVPTADYCDIIMLAQMHSYIGTPRMAELPAMDEIPAFGKIALGKLTPSRSLLVLDKAKEEVDTIRQLLGSPN